MTKKEILNHWINYKQIMLKDCFAFNHLQAYKACMIMMKGQAYLLKQIL